MSRSTQRSRRTYLLPPLVYLLVALSGPASYLFAISQSIDGNIGAGAAILWTAVWGFPWSIWPFMHSTAWDTGLLLILLACALVNVGVLALMMWWRWRRAASKPAVEPSAQASSAATHGEN